MWCLYASRIMTKCPLKRGVHLRKVRNVVYVSGIMTKCPLD